MKTSYKKEIGIFISLVSFCCLSFSQTTFESQEVISTTDDKVASYNNEIPQLLSSIDVVFDTITGTITDYTANYSDIII